MVWASDPGRAFEDVARLTAYLGLFALIVLASRRSSSGAWARGIAAGLGGLAAAALLAFFQPSLFGDAATSLASAIPSAAGRLSYPVGYWNGLGACMALAVVLLGWLAARADTRQGRATATAFLAIAVLALDLTQSLGGAAAAAAGGAAMIGFARERAALLAAAAPGFLAGVVLVLVASARGARGRFRRPEIRRRRRRDGAALDRRRPRRGRDPVGPRRSDSAARAPRPRDHRATAIAIALAALAAFVVVAVRSALGRLQGPGRARRTPGPVRRRRRPASSRPPRQRPLPVVD